MHGNFNKRNAAKYKANFNFFKTWTPKMAWVLGFIAADGCITNNKKQHSLRIVQTNKNVLEKVKKALNSNHQIYEYKRAKSTWSDPFELCIYNKEMVKDLIKLKMTPRKSLTLKMPKVPKKFLNHFVRGVSDGDGCIRCNKHEHVHRISYSLVDQITSGSLKFFEDLKFNLNKAKFNLSLRPSKGCWVMTISGQQFFKWLYKDKDCWYMETKFKKYQNILALIKASKENPYPQTMLKPIWKQLQIHS